MRGACSIESPASGFSVDGRSAHWIRLSASCGPSTRDHSRRSRWAAAVGTPRPPRAYTAWMGDAADEARPSQGEVIDPVCGMSILPSSAVGHLERGGDTYYFCNQQLPGAVPRETPRSSCQPDSGDAAPALARRCRRAEYTCPMDPEVRQHGPGRLPEVRHGARAGARSRRSRRPSGPARCTRRSSATSRARARSAAWRSSRAS